MPDIDAQLDTLEALQDQQFGFLQGNYPELASAPIEGYEGIWEEYLAEAQGIELTYAKARHDAQVAHTRHVYLAELAMMQHGHTWFPDHVCLPRFTLWDIVLGLLGR